MLKFVYNSIKNANISQSFFELNYNYNLYMLFEKDINSYSCLKMANVLTIK